MAESKRKRIMRSRSDLIYDIVVYVILTLVLLVVAYPVYFVIISSISDPGAVTRGEVILWARGFTLEGYTSVFENQEVVRSFVNSVIYTVVGTVINIVVTIPTAYVMSRSDLRGRGILIAYFMITMYVSGGLIPTYLVIKDLKMIDTIWALVVPGALSVYNMIVAMSFFRANLPLELLEASRVDGCSNTRFFFKIAVPLSSSIIAILVLYYGVGHWNSYYNALVYITTREKWPLQLVLRTVLVLSAGQLENVKDVKELQRLQMVQELMKYSLIIVSSLPIMFVYPFIQRHFVKGVMIGSVKG